MANQKNISFIIILTTFLLMTSLGCRLLNQLGSTGTPLAEIDLSQVALKSTELPDSSFQLGETLSGPSEFEGQIFVDYPEVHTGLVNAYYISYHTENMGRGYVNGLMVYDSTEQAQKVFNVILTGSTGDPASATQIGDESVVKRSDSGLLTILILWRYKESVNYLTIFHIDGSNLPSTEKVIQIALNIQARLEKGK